MLSLYFSYKILYKINNNTECILCKVKKQHSITYIPNQMIKNNPLIHLSPGKAIDNSCFFVCHHFILEINKCIRNNNKFNIVFDFDMYSFSRMLFDTELAFKLSTILQDIYYYRLETIYLIDAPFYIKPLLQMMKNMFSDTIYKKMQHITRQEYIELLD